MKSPRRGRDRIPRDIVRSLTCSSRRSNTGCLPRAIGFRPKRSLHHFSPSASGRAEGPDVSRQQRHSAARAAQGNDCGRASSGRRVRVSLQGMGTGKVLIPFTRVLSIVADNSDGPWRRFLSGERHVRVDQLVWVEGEAPAFSQVRIGVEHGRSLLKMPIESLHGLSFHKVLGKEFNLPTVRTSHQLQCERLSRLACRHLAVPAGTYGMVWDVVGFSHRQATTYQSLQMPSGHRPIELDIPTTGSRPDAGAAHRPMARGQGGDDLDRQALGGWA